LGGTGGLSAGDYMSIQTITGEQTASATRKAKIAAFEIPDPLFLKSRASDFGIHGHF